MDLLYDALHMQHARGITWWSCQRFHDVFHVPACDGYPDYLASNCVSFERWWCRFVRDLRRYGVPHQERKLEGTGAYELRFTRATQDFVRQWFGAVECLASNRPVLQHLADKLHLRYTTFPRRNS